jgi:hypothetical protein
MLNRAPSRVCLAALALATGSALAQPLLTTHVSPQGVFRPSGTAASPYDSLQNAACNTVSGGTVNIAPGRIHEAVTITQNVTRRAPNGIATIDGTTPQRTSLRVGSYNVRLWPGFFVGQTLAEEQRAPLIGARLDAENCDIIGIQELWDYAIDAAGVDGFLNGVGSGYLFRYYGSNFGLNANNSGLLTLSPFPIFSTTQGSYTECDGFDCDANKGYTRSVIVKNGITIALYNTHTQAGNGSDNVVTRDAQLAELAVDIIIYRSLNPSHVVIAVGDYNINAFSTEFNTLATTMSLAGLRDARSNLPCSPDFSACTACTSNTMKQIFGSDGVSTTLDHILYAPSFDGTVKVIARTYDVKSYKRTDGGEWCRGVIPTGCADDLSDHEAVFVDFDIRRITP